MRRRGEGGRGISDRRGKERVCCIKQGSADRLQRRAGRGAPRSAARGACGGSFPARGR